MASGGGEAAPTALFLPLCSPSPLTLAQEPASEAAALSRRATMASGGGEVALQPCSFLSVLLLHLSHPTPAPPPPRPPRAWSPVTCLFDSRPPWPDLSSLGLNLSSRAREVGRLSSPSAADEVSSRTPPDPAPPPISVATVSDSQYSLAIRLRRRLGRAWRVSSCSAPSAR
ncbi:hypothetical protein BS78_05G133000 [Paspalum vaginatum]|nr:hypothetical protein BS78_05G133000 [Paspalum vaginatum]